MKGVRDHLEICHCCRTLETGAGGGGGGGGGGASVTEAGRKSCSPNTELCDSVCLINSSGVGRGLLNCHPARLSTLGISANVY